MQPFTLTSTVFLTLFLGCGGGAKNCDEGSNCNDDTNITSDTRDTKDSDDTGSTQLGAVVERNTPWKNLIFITLDTLRADRINPSNMPELSAILDESIVLNNNRACSNWTFVSMGCLLTGMSSIEQGFVPMDITNYPDASTMLPEILQQSGFHTKLVGSHVLLSLGNLFQGFDQAMNLNPSHADTVTEMAINGLSDLEAHSRWLYYLHFQDPHQPFSAPDSYVPNLESLPFTGIDWRSTDLVSMLEPRWPVASDGEREDIRTNINAYYDGEVAFLDQQIGLLWDGLTNSGALTEALVVIMTDHGEQIYEHDNFTHDVDIYNEETRNVVAFWADGLEARSFDRPTSNEDISPTILNALGVEVPSQMSGVILGTAEDTRPTFSVIADEYFGVSQSVEIAGQRLIYRWDGTRELYDELVDPEESIDIYGENPALDEELFSHLLPEIEALNLILPDFSPSGL